MMKNDVPAGPLEGTLDAWPRGFGISALQPLQASVLTLNPTMNINVATDQIHLRISKP